MRHSTAVLRFLSRLLPLLLAPALKAEKLVITSSVATREYLQKRAMDGKLQRQTYVFMTGRYLAGITRDKSLDQTSFRTIAGRLALDLRSQEFYPAPSLAKADLLLVVHWGVTAGRNSDSATLALSIDSLNNINLAREETERDLDAALASNDLEAASRARDNLGNLASETKSEYGSIRLNQDAPGEDSAALLGLSAAIHKDDDTLADYERRKALFGMTREERYFVIVTAYDAPTLVSTRKLKRVWVLRASISSAGVNFPQALDRLSHISGRYFGTRQAEIAFDHTGDRKRQERVDLGELVVLGAVSP